MTLEPPAVNQIYAATCDAFVARVLGLDETQQRSVVFTDPDWTVTQIVAHLAGLVAEALAGVPGRLGSDEATARQVSDREGIALSALCAEWRSNVDALATLMEEKPEVAKGLTGDLIVHVHDIAEHLGWDIDKTSAATKLGATGYARRLQHRVGERLDLALTVHLSDVRSFDPPNPGASATNELTASSFDFLRAVTGRRSRSEVAALAWQQDATVLIDQAWRQYGQFND